MQWVYYDLLLLQLLEFPTPKAVCQPYCCLDLPGGQLALTDTPSLVTVLC